MHRQARQSLTRRQAATCELSFQAVAAQQARQAQAPQQAAQVRRAIVNSAGKVVAAVVLLWQLQPLQVMVEQVGPAAVVEAEAVQLWQRAVSAAMVASAVPGLCMLYRGKRNNMENIENIENFFKLAGSIVAVGTVIYLAGKVRQIVDFLRENVYEMREEAKVFRQTLIDHGERLAAIEAIKRKRK